MNVGSMMMATGPRDKDSRTTPNGLTVVLGLGATGLSCARFLAGRGRRVLVLDSRERPPGAEALRLSAPAVDLVAGRLDIELPADTSEVVISPGLSLDLPIVVKARRRGITVVGDIELFARVVDRPVAAITGSNGKSTVTTMVAGMAARAGREMPAGANLGTPALDLLQMPAEAYLLELSSFQLESTTSLAPRVAAVLNVSPDHIDRHGTLDAYAAAKARIYANAETAVANRDDAVVMAMVEGCDNVVTFGLGPARGANLGLAEQDGATWLARGADALMPAIDLRVPGAHNVANALAALGVGGQLGLSDSAMIAALRAYKGLPHRSQVVAESAGVRWIDDSKATNVGAAIAAIRGMDTPVVLIAGGDGKGQDFAPLVEAMQGHVKSVLLLGADASRLAEAIGARIPSRTVDSIEAAVAAARSEAAAGDTVLLSPACSSLDMFASFAARGKAFAKAVEEGGP
jgi:UDP-N-acetylmuramoylalanine--D-glutamate ligase